ncbi:RagB/SusD family nutrient uptake outer membrane protein [Chitinophaga defluvii]|uniref:RagB/SusD family nutrient uptake outer membrane protein n=1 Tax=Chitinophaga defluvii TaxID=3163343 RepID=A0ABV2T5S9_9BACT
MKMPTYKNIGIGILLSTAMAACNLTNVTDVLPVNQVFEDQAITNLKQAQSVLDGTYGVLKTGLEFPVYAPAGATLMGLTSKPGASAGNSEQSYFDNNVETKNGTLGSVYSKAYSILNNANFIIEKTAALESTDPRKKEIIAEAKFLRALSHFYLLRLHGQFFKMDSKYGIVIKTEPIRMVKAVPRNSVKESYDIILSDLTDAIADGPEFTNTFYASKLAAKALKAKVLLYAKQYAEAATLANEVVTSGKRQLEKDYIDIFKKKIDKPLEVIFQTPFDDKSDRNNKAFMFRAYYIPSDYYVELMKGDNRDSVAIIKVVSNGTMRNNKFNGSTYAGQTLTADTEYFLRLDEIYLILAEALARSNPDLSVARDAVNVIRKRANMPDITANAKAALLEEIRIEKIKELGGESGEEWFDLVRYATEGNLKVSDYKPGVVNELRYILPLPFETVRLSNGVLEQNPGY